jgi:hypothetical protein
MSDVTVHYAFGAQNQATVEILVELEESGEAKLVAALPCLPRGAYRVTWVLVPGPGVSNPIFDDVNGIEFVDATKPPHVEISNSHRKAGEPSVWEADIENQVVGANAMHYFAHGKVDNTANGNGGSIVFFTREHFDHDPTVAVTPDPPPGG